MKTAVLTWDLPTTRESGNDLDPSELDRADIEVSADQGQNWGPVNSVPVSEPQTLTIPDLDVGTWFFRVSVVDTDGRRSPWATISGDVLDETPPGAVLGLAVTFE